MSRKKSNVNYIKPEDPEFLKVLKRQAGYDDRNHKFDDLQNAEEDFAEDEDSEQPQVVVLKKGDLTAEEAEMEKQRMEKEEAETKADLSQRVLFKSKHKTVGNSQVRKRKEESKSKVEKKKIRPILSFGDEDEEED